MISPHCVATSSLRPVPAPRLSLMSCSHVQPPEMKMKPCFAQDNCPVVESDTISSPLSPDSSQVMESTVSEESSLWPNLVQEQMRLGLVFDNGQNGVDNSASNQSENTSPECSTVLNYERAAEDLQNCIQEYKSELPPSQTEIGELQSNTLPVWSLMSDELGFDASTLSLPQFLELMEGNPNIDVDQLQAVLQIIREDIQMCKANGSCGAEAFL